MLFLTVNPKPDFLMERIVTNNVIRSKVVTAGHVTVCVIKGKMIAMDRRW